MKNLKAIIAIVVILIYNTTPIFSQISPFQKFVLCSSQKFDSLKTKKIYKATYIAAPFILSGIVLYNPGKEFQNIRYAYAKNFSSHFDDYFQYSTTAALYGIKISGIKGKSNWLRMAATHTISAISMGIIVNGLKYATKEPRPTGYGDNSFPSGHTAVAFMSANMIHHEYGLTRSPWYSIGAFSLATATGVLRVLNNKHYVQDVIMGAGVGILSTELGYLFSDLLFKNRGIILSNKYFGNIDVTQPTSFIGIKIGFNKIFNTIPISSYSNYNCKWGRTTGLEGAFYLNDNWGFGTNIMLNSAQTTITRGDFSFNGPLINWLNIGIGPYYSIPVSDFGRFGGRAHV